LMDIPDELRSGVCVALTAPATVLPAADAACRPLQASRAQAESGHDRADPATGAQ